jgi:hypothetical protein
MRSGRPGRSRGARFVYLAGQRFLTLHYEIDRLAAARA